MKYGIFLLFIFFLVQQQCNISRIIGRTAVITYLSIRLDNTFVILAGCYVCASRTSFLPF
jgi:hypothetical protein